MILLKKFIHLFFLSFFLFSFSQLAYSADFFTYTSEEYKFSIAVPNSWHIIPRNRFPAKVCQFIAVTENKNEELYIYTQSRGLKEPTLRNMSSEQVERFAKNFVFGVLQANDWEYLDYYPTSINGYPCLSFQFDSKNRGKIKIFAFVEESVIIKIFCTVAVGIEQKEPYLTTKTLQHFKLF